MELTGKRILLRDWKSKDFDIFLGWHKGHHPWMDFNGPYFPLQSEKELAAQVRFYRNKIASNNWPVFRERLVIADALTDQWLGSVSWYWQSPATNWRSIGIAIYNDEYWSKGLGYEALTLWINYLFEQDESLVRLDFRTWSGNHGMMKLGHKLGFVEEARFRKARIVSGQYYDSIGMGILREEWKQRDKVCNLAGG